MEATVPYQTQFGYAAADGWSYNSTVTPMKQIEGNREREILLTFLKTPKFIEYD